MSIGVSSYNREDMADWTYEQLLSWAVSPPTSGGSATVPFDPEIEYDPAYYYYSHSFWGNFTGLAGGIDNAIAAKFIPDSMDGLLQWKYHDYIRNGVNYGPYASGEVMRHARFSYQNDYDDWGYALFYQLVGNES